MPVNQNGDPPTPDEIRRQMHSIRQQLPQEMDGIVVGARQLVDWKHYVRRFPWGSLAAAAAAGYLSVPRRVEVQRPDPETLAKLAKQQRLVVEPRSRVEEKPGLLESAVNFAGNMLLRAGMAYVGQRIGGIVGFEKGKEDAAEARTADATPYQL